MSDPFKMEEEEPEKLQFVSEVYYGPIGDLTGKVIPILSEPKPIQEPVPEGWRINPEWVALEGAPETPGLRPKPTGSELNRSAKIHHSTLKKRDKTTINCRLKRENAEWLRSVAPKGPGGALEIGSVLDGIVERARKSGGAS